MKQAPILVVVINLIKSIGEIAGAFCLHFRCTHDGSVILVVAVVAAAAVAVDVVVGEVIGFPLKQMQKRSDAPGAATFR